MDKNIFNKLLKEKKLTETLMKDESFKEEAKRILKEEGSNVTDKDIENILKATEKVLSGEAKIKNDEDLDEVVGGLGHVGKCVARNTILSVCGIAGASLGAKSGSVLGSVSGGLSIAICDDSKICKILPDTSDVDCAINRYKTVKQSVQGPAEVVGLAGGTIGGYAFGNFICNKLGLND